MKIICLIKPAPHMFSFVNRINSEYKVSLVVLEKTNLLSANIFTKIRKFGFYKSIKIFKTLILRNNAAEKDYKTVFGSGYEFLDASIPILVTDMLNSENVFNRLKEEKPDLILDHGSSIVKKNLLNTATLSLNLHWGLSPYYRGTHCTEWALINRDPYNIGVTIHKLTKDIDGGDILAQKRATISSHDTVHSINMQLTFLGTELLLEIIKKMLNNETLVYYQQDFSLGYLTHSKQWNSILERQIKYIEKNYLIELMLKRPSRAEKLNIHQLTNETNQ